MALTAPDTPVAEAAAGMVKANVGSAIVMQGRFLAGILTERDVLRSAASGEDLRVSRVSDWMTPDPQSVSPDTTVKDLAAALGIQPNIAVKKLMEMGQLIAANQRLGCYARTIDGNDLGVESVFFVKFPLFRDVDNDIRHAH